jgi:hypothetical protein
MTSPLVAPAFELWHRPQACLRHREPVLGPARADQRREVASSVVAHPRVPPPPRACPRAGKSGSGGGRSPPPLPPVLESSAAGSPSSDWQERIRRREAASAAAAHSRLPPPSRPLSPGRRARIRQREAASARSNVGLGPPLRAADLAPVKEWKGAAGEGEEGSGRRGERKGGPTQEEERGAGWRGRGDQESRVWFGSFYIMSSSNPDCRIVRSMATVRWEKVGREGEIGPRKRSGPVVVCRAPRFRPTVNIIFFKIGAYGFY